MDAELTVRFRETSLDPYVRFFEPRLSPFTTAIVGGTMRVVGELANLDQLVVDTRVEQLDLKLFDYRVRNDGPIELTLDQNVLEIGRFRLAGEGTQLQLDGRLGLKDQTIDVQATGDANLGILQGFFRDPAQPRHGRPQGADVRLVHQAGLLPAAPRSPTGGSGTSRCRIRSSRSTDGCRSTRAASASTR